MIYSTSAHEIWSELEEIYGVSNGAQLFGLHKKLTEISQANCSVADYFTKLKMLWDDIDALCLIPVCSCGCTCGASQKLSKFQQDQRVIHFLMGLNESFNVMRGSILMRSSLPSIGQVYSLLLQEETQREIHYAGQFLPNSASLAVNSSRPGYSVVYGNTFAHKKQGFDAKKVHCNYCKKPGHLIDKCFKLHGFPPDFKFTKSSPNANANAKCLAAQVEISDSAITNSGTNFGSSTNSGSHTGSNSNTVSNSASNNGITTGFNGISPDICSQIMQLLKSASSESSMSTANFASNISTLPSFSCFSGLSNNCWILDSGASDHMCSQKSLFTTMASLERPIQISLPNGEIISITHAGTVPLVHDIILTDVLYVLHFKYNLLSISKLTQNLNCSIHFTHNSCFLQGHSLRKPLELGNSHRGLYLLVSSSSAAHSLSNSSSFFSTKNNDVSAIVWHTRLSHLSLSKLSSICHVDNDSKSLISTCEVCAKARQHRLLFLVVQFILLKNFS